MPDDYDDEDNEAVGCYTTKKFREAVEKTPDGTMIYLRGEGQFSVPNVDRLPRCIVATDEAVIMGGGHSVKAPWADVIEEVEFDWRQVP
jgi:hypothetical protein